MWWLTGIILAWGFSMSQLIRWAQPGRRLRFVLLLFTDTACLWLAAATIFYLR